jgi:hypothetical protein
VRTGDKVSVSCHKSRDSGDPSLVATDCNDLSPAAADTGLKFAKATAKLQAKIDKSCANAGNAVLGRFVTCPEPCRTSTGVSLPLSNFTQVGQCLACLAGDIIGRRNDAMLGSPTLPLGSTELRCHGSIGKGFANHLKTVLKVRQKCQKTQDKLGQFELTPCDTNDAGGAIAASSIAAQDVVGSGCSDATFSELDACNASPTVAAFEACLVAEEDPRAAEAFEASYELPSLCGNGILDAGEICESNGVDSADCDYDCTDVVCGDGHTNSLASPVPEVCDGGQCCTETCTFQPEDTPCDDGSICTIPDACNATGSCIGHPEPALPIDCEAAGSPAGSKLKLKNNGAKDRLTWSWGKNATPLTMASFGNPTASDTYTLCLYTNVDSTTQIYRSIRLFAGSRWTNKNNKKFQFKDRTLSPDGASSALLKPGEVKKAKIKVKAKGANLGFSSLADLGSDNAMSKVKLQLRNLAGACFEAEFTGPITDPKYKGKN